MSLDANKIVKPVATAAFIALGEHFIFGNNDPKSIAMYAGAVGLSLAVSSAIAPSISPDLKLNIGTLVNGKMLEERIIECGFGIGASYVLNHFILKNRYDFKDPAVMKRIGVLIASEILGEYAGDFVQNKPLDYFS